MALAKVKPTPRRKFRAVFVAIASVGLVAVVLVTISATMSMTISGTGKSVLSSDAIVPATARAIGPFKTEGNVIYNALGQPFFIHGVNRPSLEWSCTGQSLTGAPQIPSSDFSTMATKWATNTVRLPLNQDFWLSAIGWKVSPQSYCPNYIATVRKAVKEAQARGMAVILDLHWSDRGNAMGRPAQQPMADQNSIAFWQSVSKTFGKNPGVMFELYNEPHSISWSIWRNGGMVGNGKGRFRAVGMQQLVDTVRASGTNNLVLAGGIHWASDLSEVPSYRLDGSNIAYAVHPYESKYPVSPSAWEAKFGFLSRTVPVVATEFGSTQSGVNPYDNSILAFFGDHGIGYTAWAWWAGGPSFPSLLAAPSGQCINGGCSTRADLLAMHSGSRSMKVSVTGRSALERASTGWRGTVISLTTSSVIKQGTPIAQTTVEFVPSHFPMVYRSQSANSKLPESMSLEVIQSKGLLSAFTFVSLADGSYKTSKPTPLFAGTHHLSLPASSGPTRSFGVILAGPSSAAAEIKLSGSNP